jgi:hypothetical protein
MDNGFHGVFLGNQSMVGDAPTAATNPALLASWTSGLPSHSKGTFAQWSVLYRCHSERSEESLKNQAYRDPFAALRVTTQASGDVLQRSDTKGKSIPECQIKTVGPLETL